MTKYKPTLKELEDRVTALEKSVFGCDIIHWTKRFGVTYDTPVDGEPIQCPKCGSKKLGRTMEFASCWRSPLMCLDCRHTFGGNVPNYPAGVLTVTHNSP